METPGPLCPEAFSPSTWTLQLHRFGAETSVGPDQPSGRGTEEGWDLARANAMTPGDMEVNKKQSGFQKWSLEI